MAASNSSDRRRVGPDMRPPEFLAPAVGPAFDSWKKNDSRLVLRDETVF